MAQVMQVQLGEAEAWDSVDDGAHLPLVKPQTQLCSSAQLPMKPDEASLQGNGSQESSQGNGRPKLLLDLPEVVPSACNKSRSNEMQSDLDGHSSQLSGQHRNNQVPGPAAVSSDKLVETPRCNKGITLPDATNAAAVRPHDRGMDGNSEQDKRSTPSNLPAQGPDSTPSIVCGTALRSTGVPGNDSSPTSSARPTMVGSSQAHHPLSIESSWQAMENEANRTTSPL